MSKCKYCGAEIVWVKTENGKSMPCDEGLVPYWENGKRDLILVKQNGEVISRCSGGEGKPDGYARTSHFATCKR